MQAIAVSPVTLPPAAPAAAALSGAPGDDAFAKLMEKVTISGEDAVSGDDPSDNAITPEQEEVSLPEGEPKSPDVVIDQVLTSAIPPMPVTVMETAGVSESGISPAPVLPVPTLSIKAEAANQLSQLQRFDVPGMVSAGFAPPEINTPDVPVLPVNAISSAKEGNPAVAVAVRPAPRIASAGFGESQSEATDESDDGAPPPAGSFSVRPAETPINVPIAKGAGMPVYWAIEASELPRAEVSRSVVVQDSAGPLSQAIPSQTEPVIAEIPLLDLDAPLPPRGEAIGLTRLSAASTAPVPISQPPSFQTLPSAIAPQIAMALQARSETPVEISLAPEELGRLRIRLSPEGETVRVLVQVERPETLDLLRRNGDVLMQELKAAGFAGGNLSFSAWGGTTQGNPTPQHDQQIEGEALTLSNPTPPAPPRIAPSQGLDLRF